MTENKVLPDYNNPDSSRDLILQFLLLILCDIHVHQCVGSMVDGGDVCRIWYFLPQWVKSSDGSFSKRIHKSLVISYCIQHFHGC